MNRGKSVIRLLCLALLALMWLTAVAAAEVTGSISCSYVLPGTTFQLYLAGRVENGIPVLTGDFADYNVDMSDVDAAMTLAERAFRNGITPAAQDLTDENGDVSFTGLQEGIYLLVGQQTAVGKYTYTPQPALIGISACDGWDRWVYLKYSRTERPEEPETPDTGQGGEPLAAVAAMLLSAAGLLWLYRRKRV